jgi:hypothetical protein
LIKQKEKDWNNDATQLCTTWANEHSTRNFRTLLKSQGYRKGTKTKSEISWNGDLTNIMAQSLSPSCNKILNTLTNMEPSVALQLESPLSSIKEKVTANPETIVMALSCFFKKVEQEKPVMRNAVKQCVLFLRRAMKTWTFDLTTNTGDSIVSVCMEKVYESAQDIKLKPAQRQAKLQDGIVGDASLWMAVHECASKRLEEMLDRRQQKFEKHVFKILEDIMEAFQSCCKDKDSEEATESALRMQLTVNLGKAREIHERVLAKAMRDCKQCYEPTSRENETNRGSEADRTEREQTCDQKRMR